MTIDLRSDTFTLPTPAMKAFMMEAELGDDVFGEDPTVNLLEAKTAQLFGMQAALFCPSGTMTNQIGIKAHTQPGDEVICENMSHVYIYEGGGIAFNSGCQVRPISGQRGTITADQIQSAINPDDIHKPATRLVCLENTTNRGGGACYDWSQLLAIRNVCAGNGLSLHLDGARLWNALVAKNETALQYGEIFDSISVCLSKGLGAPVGSVLLGDQAFINKARRIRKVFGGGMRQAGFLAAAGIYALDHHIDRLKEDHHHAQLLANALTNRKVIGTILAVETNIVIFEVLPPFTAQQFAQALARESIKVIAISPTQIRMVTHLDVTTEMIQRTIKAIDAICQP